MYKLSQNHQPDKTTDDGCWVT